MTTATPVSAIASAPPAPLPADATPQWLPSAGDWRAGLVVFIVALPLSLGIAMASGASLAAGMVTAIVGGIVVGLLSGAPLAVSGPAAGLTALVFQLVQTHGLQGLAIITFLAGAMQLLFGLCRGGALFHLLPKTTLEGVLSAIGIIIVLGQIHVLLGHTVPKGAFNAIKTLPHVIQHAALAAFVCGTLAIALQLVWNRFPALSKKVPGALPAVVVVTLIALFASLTLPRVQVAPLIPHVQHGLSSFFSNPGWSKFATYLLPAAGLALVASAESLLTAKAVTLMAQSRGTPTTLSLNKELIAQGAGNLVSAPLGGIPLTAVMVRAAANVNSGAASRWSTILHGLFLAVFVLALTFVLDEIPLAALASILILTGIRLFNVPALVKEFHHSKPHALHWAATTLAVIATDLLMGLIISVVLFYAVKALQPLMYRRTHPDELAPNAPISHPALPTNTNPTALIP